MRKIGRIETALLLIGILLVGSYFRLVGIEWGEGQAIHPDEQAMLYVVTAVELPDRAGLYFDTEHSPLNPYNRGHTFFVYGTLPLFLTRSVAEGLDRSCEDPSGLTARLMAPLLLGRPAEECWPGSFTGAGIRMVGRLLAALFDVLSLIFLFLAGRRLISWRGGFLAALLYALAVLPIQQSHFFTVDAFTNLFVAATLYWSIRSVQTGGWGSFALAGLTTGLGMACKVSVWPLGLLVGLAGAAWGWTHPKSLDGLKGRPYGGIVGRVALAGGMAFLAFRIAQPYAFVGPGFFGALPNPQWLGNMSEIRRQMSGTVDVYHGHQWTDRTPIIFPWISMVFWGLGLPLGLAAWIGWAWAGVDLYRRWRGKDHPSSRSTMNALFLIWIWGTGYFLYQGTQWVKSMRYLLPTYPAFILLAVWLLVRLRQGRGESRQGGDHKGRSYAAVGVGAVLLGGTLFWALSLTSVYTRPHTRIAASRWIFENVPTAVTVHVDTIDGEMRVPVVPPYGMEYGDGVPVAAPFRLTQAADLTTVTLNYVLDLSGDLEAEVIQVAVAADAMGEEILAENTLSVDATALSTQSFTFPLDRVELEPDQVYYVITQVIDGGPVQLLTSILATEHWDWAPPLRVDGRDPFGGMYRGLSSGELALYYDETPEKRDNMLSWLDEADYIITASNRLYASIPRLPTRYPLAMAYYEALFNGELGFELVGDFSSYLSLGPLQFPDQEEPFPVPESPYQYRAGDISVPMPPAEEAFSVYDHPRVLVFRKTADYSREKAEEILSLALLEEVVWVTPHEVTRGTKDAILDPETWEQQQAGGTWSEQFNRQSLVNRSSVFAALVWYLAAALLGWFVFPVLFVAFPRLSDRGYGLARALGILGVGYLTWLAASLHLLPNTRGTVLLAALLLAVAGGSVAWRKRGMLRDFLSRRWKLILFYELLFLVLFSFWALSRAINPDLWHPVVGGEKPMDFAYLNAVVKSSWFPPYDPWFAGGSLNYYYFGFVLVSSLAKLTTIMPSMAYNLSLALFYALTGGAVFSVAFSLADRGDGSRRPYLAGILAVLFMVILGNLGEVRFLFNSLRELGGEPTFQSTIPGLPELVQVLRGFGMVLRGSALPVRPETPYWDPTRMVPFPAFTEFPAFTFLYGDPHAHMFALPYTIVVLGIALNWARGAWRLREGWLLSGLWGGLVIGSLLACNTWDYPTYLLVGLGGLVLGLGFVGKQLFSLAWRTVMLVVLSIALFLPYLQNYISPVSALELWQGERIPLGIYLLITGHFLFPLFTLLVAEGRRHLKAVWHLQSRLLRLSLALIVSGVLFLSLALGLFSVPVAIVTIPLGIAALLLVLDSETPLEQRAVWLLLALSMGMSLAVEIVSVGGDRMNTVFKFHFQIWTFLAVASAVAVSWLWKRVRGWSLEAQQVWWVVMGGLWAAMTLFPVMSMPAKLRDRLTHDTGLTLDGMAYMEHSTIWDVKGEVKLNPDYQAMVWMQENIEGSPVVLEGLGEREYLWGNRISIYTGLPTVIGWRWHQVQQRMGGQSGEVERRRLDVNSCYTLMDIELTVEILEQYNIKYIYVGPYERLYYVPHGLVKFDVMVSEGRLQVVYDQNEVKIYEVVQ